VRVWRRHLSNSSCVRARTYAKWLPPTGFQIARLSVSADATLAKSCRGRPMAHARSTNYTAPIVCCPDPPELGYDVPDLQFHLVPAPKGQVSTGNNQDGRACSYADVLPYPLDLNRTGG